MGLERAEQMRAFLSKKTCPMNPSYGASVFRSPSFTLENL